MIDADPAPARQSPPTIRDVAREAGVTVGTASKALNGRGQLRAETRDRVRAAAAHLEFRPNDLVKSAFQNPGSCWRAFQQMSAQPRERKA
jgi:LacI family transcriptional regulator